MSLRPCRVAVFRSYYADAAHANELTNVVAQINDLIFAPELPFPEERQFDEDHTAVRWMCQSCYAASGRLDDVFRTEAAYLKDVRKSDGPTDKQRGQMSDHSIQHTIMWAWARSLK